MILLPGLQWPPIASRWQSGAARDKVSGFPIGIALSSCFQLPVYPLHCLECQRVAPTLLLRTALVGPVDSPICSISCPLRTKAGLMPGAVSHKGVQLLPGSQSQGQFVRSVDFSATPRPTDYHFRLERQYMCVGELLISLAAPHFLHL